MMNANDNWKPSISEQAILRVWQQANLMSRTSEHAMTDVHKN